MWYIMYYNCDSECCCWHWRVFLHQQVNVKDKSGFSPVNSECIGLGQNIVVESYSNSLLRYMYCIRNTEILFHNTFLTHYINEVYLSIMDVRGQHCTSTNCVCQNWTKPKFKMEFYVILCVLHVFVINLQTKCFWRWCGYLRFELIKGKRLQFLIILKLNIKMYHNPYCIGRKVYRPDLRVYSIYAHLLIL